jgi:endoribonuclease Dicer
MAELPNLQDMNCEQICNLVREKSNFKEGDQGSPRHANKLKTNDKVALEKLPSFVPYNLLTQHSIPDKSIADCVEALIGAYLIACGPKGALVFMKWLGLDLLSSAPEKLKSSKEEEEQERRINTGDIFPIPLSPLLDNSKEGQIQLEFLLNGYDKFEDLIGYKFRDRSYLLQAFTHASYYPNRLTDCYQR